MKNKIKINYFYKDNINYQFRKYYKSRLNALIENIAVKESVGIGTVNIVYCNDNMIMKYNKKYLSHEYFTDIITFSYPEKDYIDADMLISLDSVLSNSKKYKTDFEKELFRVIIHGILHICGYEDTKKSDRLKMKQKEDLYLKFI